MAASASPIPEIDAYYDEVPRRFARVEDIGSCTVFLPDTADGWSYYARPRIGSGTDVTEQDVRLVIERLQGFGAPVAIEWIGELQPALAAIARDAGLDVVECPLMVLTDHRRPAAGPAGVSIERMCVDHPRLAAVNAAIGAAFRQTDELPPGPASAEITRRLATDSFRQFGVWDDLGALGGGGHSPRGRVTELTGIGVIPRGRSRGVGASITAALVDDAHECGAAIVFLSAVSQRVAGVYEPLGFETIATACIAESP